MLDCLNQNAVIQLWDSRTQLCSSDQKSPGLWWLVENIPTEQSLNGHRCSGCFPCPRCPPEGHGTHPARSASSRELSAAEWKPPWERLGPRTLFCTACTWTQCSSSNKTQRHYKGLKIIACMHSWGTLWTKKPLLLLLKSHRQTRDVGSKSKNSTCPQNSTPPKGWANHQGVGKPPKPPLLPDPWTQPYPHPA